MEITDIMTPPNSQSDFKYPILTYSESERDEDRCIVIACFICNKPLGQESRDLEFWTCHNHRNCTMCGKNLTSVEIQWSYKNNFPLVHARCVIGSMQKEKVDLDLLNNITKLIEVDLTVSVLTNQQSTERKVKAAFHEQSLEEAYYVMKNMQAAAAAYSFMFQKDRTKIEKEISEKEKKKFKEAIEEREKPAKIKAEKAEKQAVVDSPEEKFIKNMMKGGIFTREMAAKIYQDSLKVKELQK